MAQREPLSSPGVHFPPPLLFVGGFLVGWLMHRWSPVLLPGGRGPVSNSLGWILIALGLGIMIWAVVTFRRHRTAVIPNRPAAALVSAGPYARSRNPMYVGLSVAYVGLALLTGILWAIVLLPLVLTTLVALVVSREERYLADAFGAEYAAYRARVRRWL